MASDFVRGLEVFKERVFSQAQESSNLAMKQKVAVLRKSLLTLQDNFFKILATRMINSGPPHLGVFTPDWDELDSQYTERREKEYGVSSTMFFLRTGALQSKLNSLKAKTFLGTPLVSFKQSTNTEFRSLGLNKLSRNKDNFSYLISIDMFPKFMSDIDSLDEADILDSVRSSAITEIDRPGKRTPLSFRFKAFQGERNRPVLQAYMQWWLHTETKNLVDRVLR